MPKDVQVRFNQIWPTVRRWSWPSSLLSSLVYRIPYILSHISSLVSLLSSRVSLLSSLFSRRPASTQCTPLTTSTTEPQCSSFAQRCCDSVCAQTPIKLCAPQTLQLHISPSNPVFKTKPRFTQSNSYSQMSNIGACASTCDKLQAYCHILQASTSMY